MRTAVLSDIHANLEALRACLDHARSQGVDRLAFLGDLVGYGADPVACLDIVRAEAERGAVVVRGNHDEAALGGLCEEMSFIAREAAYWTRTQLGEGERAFLAGLPYTVRADPCLFVHASADQPGEWTYIVGTATAARCLAATDAAVVFAGHVHHSVLYYGDGAQTHVFLPAPGAAVALSRRQRWLALPGSVGQPRDGNPAAAYLVFDAAEHSVTCQRVPYDHVTAARKIVAAGLPRMLAERLAMGE